jgi:hypothetical protein
MGQSISTCVCATACVGNLVTKRLTSGAPVKAEGCGNRMPSTIARVSTHTFFVVAIQSGYGLNLMRVAQPFRVDLVGTSLLVWVQVRGYTPGRFQIIHPGIEARMSSDMNSAVGVSLAYLICSP